MTEFTIESFVAKLAELAITTDEAARRALARAALVVEHEAKAAIGHDRDAAGTSIEHTVMGNEAHVGSNSERAERHELGSMHIPPRSFLAGAMAEKTDDVVKILGEGVVEMLLGRGPKRPPRPPRP